MGDRDDHGRIRVERLDRARHDRASFSCGEPTVDLYLRTSAARNQDRETARVYVAVGQAPQRILGFYSLNAHAIRAVDLPPSIQSRLPRYPLIPAVLIAMFGVDLEHQGRGLGGFLLAHAMGRCADAAFKIGAAFIVLDALNDHAARLYRRLGFVDLPSSHGRMIIGMAQVRNGMRQAASGATSDDPAASR